MPKTKSLGYNPLPFKHLASVILLPILFTLTALVSHGVRSPQIQNTESVGGSLNLKKTTFDTASNFWLSGEWKFKSGSTQTLRNVPDQWKGTEAGGPKGMGHGIYSLRILLDEKRDLALKIPTISTAYMLFINGKLHAQAGRPSKFRDQSQAAYFPQVVPLPQVENGEILIEIEVSNWDYRVGGMWRAPTLGLKETLFTAQFQSNAVTLGFSFILLSLGIIGLGAFFFLPAQKSLFYFFLFSLLLGLRALVTGDYLIIHFLPGIPFDHVIRLEYLTVFLPVPFFAFFLYYYYFPLLKVKQTLLPQMSFLPFLLSLFIFPLHLLTQTLMPFYFVIAFGGVYLLFIIVRKIFPTRKRSGAILLSGGSVLILGTVNDALYSGFLTHSGNLLPLAQLLFVLMLGTLILRKVTQAFHETVSLTQELQNRQKKLFQVLSEKDSLIMEIHHRVKNSLQIINSIMNMEESRFPANTPLHKTWKSMRIRVVAMGLVQDSLIGMENQDRVRIFEFIKRLLKLLVESFPGEAEKFQANSDCQDLTTDAGKCQDLGLMLVEIFTQALEKKGAQPLDIEIQILGSEDSWEFQFRDNGLPFEEGFSPREDSSLSWRIIHTLSPISETSLQTRNTPSGTEVLLRFETDTI